LSGSSKEWSPLRTINRRLDDVLCAVLEVSAVAAYGYWAWANHAGLVRAAWALGAMVVAATVWDVFQVPGDSGLKPAVATPGWARLLLEAAYFTGVTTSLVASGLPELGFCFALLVAIHYTLTYRRVLWLVREGQSGGDG
jgi:Protein of unknown function (DUF2568)